MSTYKVAIVDDHNLFADSLMGLINNFKDFEVQYCVTNGQELIDNITPKNDFPDIILLDINMPVMNGIQTMAWLYRHQPSLKVLALSMDDSEETIIKMLRNGAKGYLLKDIHPDELENALNQTIKNGFYYTEKVSNSLISSLNLPADEIDDTPIELNDRERRFLKFACTDKTYKEIADMMMLSPKTIDGYRESVFKKFKVGNRVGLVLYAIRNGFIEI